MAKAKVTERLGADERRLQIAETALGLIAEEGASSLTAAVLARAIGVTDAALFRHFPSMEAIVDAAIESFGELLEGSLGGAEEDPVERLRGFFLHRLALVQARPEVLRLAFNDRLADAAGTKGVQRVRALVGRSREYVQRCLLEAQGQGLVRADVPVEMLAWTVFGFMRGAGLGRPGRTAPPTSAEVWSALALLIGVTTRRPIRAAKQKRRPARAAGSRGEHS